MKKVILLCTLLTICTCALAIKPKKEYSCKPSDFGVKFKEKVITTNDGAQINTWYMPSPETSKGTVILVYADAGNMGEWFSWAGVFLSGNYDVYMFDYRGFGTSSDFTINPDQLYYSEFVSDLAAVVDYAKASGADTITIFGASMGSIVATEYAKEHNVDRLIFDSPVLFPKLATQRIKDIKGKDITLPETLIKDRTINAQTLILVGSDDFLCDADDLKNAKNDFPNMEVKTSLAVTYNLCQSIQKDIAMQSMPF